jgi:hypothetical protein
MHAPTMRGPVYQYRGSYGAPFPPAPSGFSPVEWHDATARARAAQLAAASVRVESGAPATLGEPPDEDALDAWQFRDEMLPTGLYRFFVYEHANGRAVGALRFDGTLGATSSTQDTGAAATTTTVAAPDPNVAAVNMQNAINNAGGFRDVDMPIYEAFQQAAGLTVDGFPGPNTIQALAQNLAAQGLQIVQSAYRSDGTPYPWVGNSCANYDGTNAPALSQWCSGASGAGNTGCCGGATPGPSPSPQPSPGPSPGPTPPATASTSSGGGTALLILGALAATVAAVVGVASHSTKPMHLFG